MKTFTITCGTLLLLASFGASAENDVSKQQALQEKMARLQKLCPNGIESQYKCVGMTTKCVDCVGKCAKENYPDELKSMLECSKSGDNKDVCQLVVDCVDECEKDSDDCISGCCEKAVACAEKSCLILAKCLEDVEGLETAVTTCREEHCLANCDSSE